jgi:hypothetical protein
VAAEREDGSSIKRFEIAFSKAHGASALGMGSRALMDRAEQQPYFIAAATAGIGGQLVQVSGGVQVRGTEGQLLGSLGYPVTRPTTTRRPPSPGLKRWDWCHSPRASCCGVSKVRQAGGRPRRVSRA